MNSSSARILSRHETNISPWIGLIEKAVEFAPGQQSEIYHCFAQADYIAILARTPTGLIPIVRQYRPAVEAYTWELPAGLLEAGEDPEESCRRELKEETGLEARVVTSLGSYYADTGRLENKEHVFYVEASEPDPEFIAEPGMSVRFVTLETLNEMVAAEEFRHQLHVAVLFLYQLKIVS